MPSTKTSKKPVKKKVKYRRDGDEIPKSEHHVLSVAEAHKLRDAIRAVVHKHTPKGKSISTLTFIDMAGGLTVTGEAGIPFMAECDRALAKMGHDALAANGNPLAALEAALASLGGKKPGPAPADDLPADLPPQVRAIVEAARAAGAQVSVHKAELPTPPAAQRPPFSNN